MRETSMETGARKINQLIFSARRYAQCVAASYAIGWCLSGCMYACHVHVSKRLNIYLEFFVFCGSSTIPVSVFNTKRYNPTIRLPGFNLGRSAWSMLNRLRTDRCAANLHKWHMASSDRCQCGGVQTMSRVR